MLTATMLTVDGHCRIDRLGGFAQARGSIALFLDRDNLLIADPGFIHRADDVRLIDGAARLVGWANRRAMPAIVVTNQSGIGRGLFGWEDFAAVNQRMQQLLAAQGAALDAIIACSALAEARHPWRKPRGGMFAVAHGAFGVDLARSWMVGDRLTDIRAARAAGLAGAVLVRHDDAPPRTARQGRGTPFRMISVASPGDALRCLDLEIAGDGIAARRAAS